jgi:gluconolactonase
MYCLMTDKGALRMTGCSKVGSTDGGRAAGMTYPTDRILMMRGAIWGCPAIKVILVTIILSTWILGAAHSRDFRQVIAASGLLFPEGTIFVGSNLYFVDYARSDVLRLVDGEIEPVWHQDGCGANGLVEVPTGLLVACFDSGTVVEISMAGATLKTIRRDDGGQALSAPNDFTADQKGGIYLSDSGSSSSPGKVFYLSRDQMLREVASGIRFANGIGVSRDGATLYVAESPTGKVLAFPIKADGSVGPPRDFIRLRDILSVGRVAAATPDSLRVDTHGNVFVALYDGGGVAIVSPAGRLLILLDVPSQHHTNLAISPGGESLYITAIDDDAQATYRGQIVRMANPLAP